MKTEHDTWGRQHCCVNYEACPLCYGCRAYDPSWYKCRHCEEDSKNNVCNKKRHTVRILNKMIGRRKLHV